MNRILGLLALAGALCFAWNASAQQYHDAGNSVVPGFVPLAGCSASGLCAGPAGPSNPLYVSGAFSLAGFSPSGAIATLSASDASSHEVALPTGTDFKVENDDANDVRCALGTGAAVASLTSAVIPAKSTRAVHGVYSATTYTDIACLSASSSLNVTIEGGAGLATDSGGGGSGGGSGAAADSTLNGSGTISAANNFSTGMTVASNVHGAPAILTGTPTAGSTIQFSGFSGANSGWLECTGAGLTGANAFEVDVSGPSGGTYWDRKLVFTTPISRSVNLAGATFLQVMADTFTSGSPTCTLRLSANIADTRTPSIPVFTAALSTTIEAVAPNAGVVTSIYCANTNSTWVYIQLFDAAPGSATLGTPTGGAYGITNGIAGGISIPVEGISFANAISVAAATTATGTTAPAAGVDCTFTYHQ